jgi:hypothetical protein
MHMSKLDLALKEVAEGALTADYVKENRPAPLSGGNVRTL